MYLFILKFTNFQMFFLTKTSLSQQVKPQAKFPYRIEDTRLGKQKSQHT